MSAMILSWCPTDGSGDPNPNDPCFPCKPKPLPSPISGGGGGGTPGQDPGWVTINQIEIVTDQNGGTANYSIGSMTYAMQKDCALCPYYVNPTGAFGQALIWSYPYTFAVEYLSIHCWYDHIVQIQFCDTPISYATGPLSGTDPIGNNATDAAAQNAAITGAYATWGLTPP